MDDRIAPILGLLVDWKVMNVSFTVFISDYIYMLWGITEGSVEMENARHHVHDRNAEKLKNLFFKNGGIYI